LKPGILDASRITVNGTKDPLDRGTPESSCRGLRGTQAGRRQIGSGGRGRRDTDVDEVDSQTTFASGIRRH
jgi:hypothetical protein